MDILGDINFITIAIALLFGIPILIGILRPFSSDRVQNSILSLIYSVELIISIILALFITRVLLSDMDNVIWKTLYKIVPTLMNITAIKQIWVYFIATVLVIFAIDGILHLLTIPIYRYAIVPMAKKISSSVNSTNGFIRRIIGGLWQIPNAIWLVLAFSLFLNFYISLNGSSKIADYARDSAPYQLIDENVMRPLLNNGVVKNIQVLLNDSFELASDNNGNARNSRLVIYFNGVTLDEAVKSNAQIDAAARSIVGSETSDKEKARLLYRWVSKSIQYDNQKAEMISKDPSKVKSGAIVTYDTRVGVCFDYASLYAAMCRAVNVKVRFVTGLGYSGTAWGDHAWNQVYDSTAKRWIHVDATFGNSGINFFDSKNFNDYHKDAQVQGEW